MLRNLLRYPSRLPWRIYDVGRCNGKISRGTSGKNSLRASRFSSASPKTHCLACGALLESKYRIFCNACGALCEVDERHSYFDIFDIPPTFQVDLERLKMTYHELQKQLHPDKFSTAPETVVGLSAQHSSRVNEGYTTLCQPLSRGLYLHFLLHG